MGRALTEAFPSMSRPHCDTSLGLRRRGASGCGRAWRPDCASMLPTWVQTAFLSSFAHRGCGVLQSPVAAAASRTPGLPSQSPECRKWGFLMWEILGPSPRDPQELAAIDWQPQDPSVLPRSAGYLALERWEFVGPVRMLPTAGKTALRMGQSATEMEELGEIRGSVQSELHLKIKI